MNSQSDTSLSNSQQDALKYQVFWAKVHTFPYWPARHCSVPEGIELFKSKSIKSKSTKALYPVSFLGIKLEKGLVVETGIIDFNQESLSMKNVFQLKLFRNDLDYRAAVIEAVRIAVYMGRSFSDEIMDLVREYGEECPFDRSDVCTECGGSEFSGPSLLCDNCDVNETHFHCLSPPLLRLPPGKWFCNSCCDNHGYPRGTFLPPDEADISNDDIATTNENNDSNKNAHGKENKRILLDKNNKVKKRSKIVNTSFDSKNDNSFPKDTPIDFKESNNDTELLGVNCNSNILKRDNHIDEFCFVCKEGGRLILCDFPDCSKAYHQMCVLSTIPYPAFAKDNIEMDDAWFCPRHYCVQCSSLENHEIFSNCTKNSSIRFPSYLLSKEICMKSLKFCTTCPFSICTNCELDIINECGVRSNSKSGVLNQRRGALTKDLECLNCLSDFSILKLAKLLEKSWIRLSNSRLSVPFLRPLLPLTDEVVNDNNMSILDILKIIEKIHKLEYVSSSMYISDLIALRKHFIGIIEDKYFLYDDETNKFVSDSKKEKFKDNDKSDYCLDNLIITSKMCDEILNGLDTIIDTSQNYLLNDKNIIIISLDKKINEITNGNNSIDNIDSALNTSDKLSNYLLKLWRKECHNSWRNFLSEDKYPKKPQNGSSYDFHKIEFSVDKRSIQGWANYISYGAMPDLCKGLIDPWSIWNVKSTDNFKKNDNNQLLKEFLSYSVSSTFSNDYETAELMLNMSNNLSNEPITLLENQPYARKSINSWNKAYDKSIKSRSDVHESLLSDFTDIIQRENTDFNDDESNIILEKLQDLTTKSLEIQVKLRQEMLKQKQKKVSIGNEVISFGDASLIKELILANDNLKWQLNQRNKTIESCKIIINDLNEKYLQQNHIITELENQINLFKNVDNDSTDRSKRHVNGVL